MAVSPAAGPLMLREESLRKPITIPPTIPAMIPENRGAPEPRAIPRHKGNAIRNTTTEAGMSEAAFLKIFFIDFNN
jgi:hypothetical protein